MCPYIHYISESALYWAARRMSKLPFVTSNTQQEHKTLPLYQHIAHLSALQLQVLLLKLQTPSQSPACGLLIPPFMGTLLEVSISSIYRHNAKVWKIIIELWKNIKLFIFHELVCYFYFKWLP